MREDLVVCACVQRDDEVADGYRVGDVLERGQVEVPDLVGHQDGLDHDVAHVAEDLQLFDLAQHRDALGDGACDVRPEGLLDLLVGVGGVGADSDVVGEAQRRRGEAGRVYGPAGKRRDGDVELVRQSLPVPVGGGAAVPVDGGLPADARIDLLAELLDRRAGGLWRSRRGDAVANLRVALEQRRCDGGVLVRLHARGLEHRIQGAGTKDAR